MERQRDEIDQLLGEIGIPEPIQSGFHNHLHQQLFYQQQQHIDPLEYSFSRLSLAGNVPKNGFHQQPGPSPGDSLTFRSSPSSSFDSSSSEELSPELYGYSLWNYSSPPPEPEPLSLFHQQFLQKALFQQQPQQRFSQNSYGVPLIPPPAPVYNHQLLHPGKPMQLRGMEHPGARSLPPACRFFAQGNCGRAENCPFPHTGRGFNVVKNHQQSQARSVKASGLEDHQFKLFGEKLVDHSQKYESLEAMKGSVVAAAKDQHGCRFLQKRFEEGNKEEIGVIFGEVIEQLAELMMDPFGNYLVQKLLEICSEAQVGEILRAVAGKGELVNISLNMHGTRAVQKLIEVLKEKKKPELILMVIDSLRESVVTLSNDLNGNHVVQKCLQFLSSENIQNIQFIIDAAAEHCVEIATHRHGCCVLQRCLDFASAEQRHLLVSVIASNALTLSQDQYGNYVVQYVVGLEQGWAMIEVMMRLEGNFGLLSMQKFSSNVVEKCLKYPGEEYRNGIIRELISTSGFTQLLQDPFANYVIQCALSFSKGSVHTALVEAIKPHVGMLRSSPYGKRILSRANIKK